MEMVAECLRPCLIFLFYSHPACGIVGMALLHALKRLSGRLHPHRQSCSPHCRRRCGCSTWP